MSAPSLEVITGAATGLLVDVPPSGLEVGREVVGAGQLGGDPGLSRHHARFSPAGDQGMFVWDLNSTNGTFVNGRRLSEPCLLREGDVVRVGSSDLRVHLPSRPPTSESGVSVSGGLAVSQGSVGAVGSVGGNLDLSRRDVYAGHGSQAAGRDLYNTHQRFDVDGSGLGFFARARGTARTLIILGFVLFALGFASFAYPIVRSFSASSGAPNCSQYRPGSNGWSACESSGTDQGFNPSPWMPIGFVLGFLGIVVVYAGVFAAKSDS